MAEDASSENHVSPQEFVKLYASDGKEKLRTKDCSRLMTRLQVNTPEYYRNQTDSTPLNSRQYVFVTPAASWLSQDHTKPVAALDHVGWNHEDILWAHDNSLSARLWVWEVDREESEAVATWDYVITTLGEAAQTGTSLTEDKKGIPLWSKEPEKNLNFVAWVRDRQSDIEALQGWEQDDNMGVDKFWDNPSVLAARQAVCHLLYIAPLFKGDGFTYNGQGERKAPEFLIKTQSFGELTSLAHLDFGLVKLEEEQLSG